MYCGKKLVRIINSHIAIYGCCDIFHEIFHVEDSPAIIIIDEDGEPHIRLDGKEIYRASEIPSTINNTLLEILDDGALVIILFNKEKKICKAFTDGEYTYMPCILLEDINKLLHTT